MYYARQKPLFHLGKFPIGATELIILLQIIGALLVVFTQMKIIPHVALSAEGVLAGKLWQIVTYTFFSPIGFMFIIGLFFFYQFGRMVENEIGRTSFLLICGMVILSIPLVMVLYSFTGARLSPLYFGGQILHLVIFCCFCVMYPNLPTMLLKIPIKWLGLAFFVISLATSAQSGSFDIMISILLANSLGIITIQSQGKALVKIFPDSWTQPSKPKNKSPRKTAPTKSVANKEKVPTSSKLKPRKKVRDATEVDAILDKINEKGLHSLTENERNTLLKAKK